MEEHTEPQITTYEPEKSWITDELTDIQSGQTFDGNRLPALQLEENKITEFEIDFSKKFDEWEDTANKATKAIIPVRQNGADKIWWLNKRNPIYREVLQRGKSGQRQFKVMQTGSKQLTKYNLIED